MDFDKRAKKYKRKSKYKQYTEDPNILGVIQIDEVLLNLFCAYSVSQNAAIRKYGLSSLYNLLTSINEDYFFEQQALLVKYKFVLETLRQRLNGIHNRDLLLQSANLVVDVGSLLKDPLLLRELSTDEVKYTEMAIGEIQNNMYINRHLGDFKSLMEQYEKADFRGKKLLLPKIQKVNADLSTEFRRNDVNRDTSDTCFRLSDMKNCVTDIHRQVTSPSFKLITGMQAINAMLGGGLEGGNVYSFFGLPGEGKTVTLENLLYQLWKYNKGYQCKDKTKKPAIVLLTMENFVRQTVCALFHILTGGKNLKDCKTAKEAIQEFESRSFEFNGEEGSIEIVVKFKPINSVTTNYLYELTENLEDEGFEVIAFLQDYVKRILPVLQTNDPYQDLGNVINDFKTFATLKNIPVITASQLNREAARMIDEARSANKNDLIKKLSRANIGESSRIDENLDGTFIIAPEVSADGKKYMGFKLTKHRYEIFTKVVSIYQPFKEGTEIALEEDIYETKAAYRESLMRDAEEIRQSFGDVERVSINRTVKSLEFLNRNADHMIKPGITSFKSPIKKEPQTEHSLKGLIPKKEVMGFVDMRDIERRREEIGIAKAV